jgi:putative PIN family toxin of toxin-antitoxin system
MKARPPQVVLDTNVIVAGLRSPTGAAHALLRMLPAGLYDVHVSLPLIIQYEDVLARNRHENAISPSDRAGFLVALDALATHHDIHYLLRPELDDPEDDMVLEVAFAARADFVVTHNVRHFATIGKFGIRAVTPVQFLNALGELS